MLKWKPEITYYHAEKQQGYRSCEVGAIGKVGIEPVATYQYYELV